MSNAPGLLPGVPDDTPAAQLTHLRHDGLEDAREHLPMGVYAERCAARLGYDRASQDRYALSSLQRVRAAMLRGRFDHEIVPLKVPMPGGTVTAHEDEPPRYCLPERIARLPPAFNNDGTITAASSATIADGAAALLLMRAGSARRAGLTTLARIVATSDHAGAPADFPTAPIGAIRQLLERTGWRPIDVDLYEINEAFAVVVLAAIDALDLPAERVNVDGGACAIGHPIGASGARLVVTLVHGLHAHRRRRGVAALCIGGGEALAIAVERC